MVRWAATVSDTTVTAGRPGNVGNLGGPATRPNRETPRRSAGGASPEAQAFVAPVERSPQHPHFALVRSFPQMPIRRCSPERSARCEAVKQTLVRQQLSSIVPNACRSKAGGSRGKPPSQGSHAPFAWVASGTTGGSDPCGPSALGRPTSRQELDRAVRRPFPPSQTAAR